MISPSSKQTPSDASFVEFYKQEGYCIQPNVFSALECEAYIQAGIELKDYRNGITKPAMMPHRENSIFLQAMKNPSIVTMMESLVGGQVAGLQTEFFYCNPGTRGFSLHQDNFFVQAPEGAFASAWCALTDTYKEKAGLIVYPGTHKEGMLPVQKITLQRDAGQDPNANNEETIVPEAYKAKVMDASVAKGSALYIHGGLVHGSNANLTNESRYVLLITYIRKGATFRPGNYAGRAEVDVYS